MDVNGIISLILVGLFVLAFAMRGRTKRADRRRDEAAARERAAQADDRSLY